MNITQVLDTLTRMENDTATTNFQKGQETLGTGEIGKDAFLQLLLAQLKHQDPMNPVDDSEFISQQAQFTQIEQLEELNSNIQLSNQISQASNMVGKEVEVALEDGSTIIGRVGSVIIASDGTGIRIGDELYSPDQIIQIFAEGFVDEATNGGESSS